MNAGSNAIFLELKQQLVNVSERLVDVLARLQFQDEATHQWDVRQEEGEASEE